MSELRFQCNFMSTELAHFVLPVEVRKANLALVTQTLSTQSVHLEPGTYYVTARLPAGQELYNHIVLGDTDATIKLTPDPEDVTPNESLEVQRFIIGQQVPVGSPAVEMLGAEDVEAKLRLFNGNGLQGPLAIEDAQTWLTPLLAPSSGVAKFKCTPGKSRLVQLLQPNVPPTNIVLPVSPQSGCQLVLTLLPDDTLSVDVHLDNLEANTLLRYYERGLLDKAATATDIPSLQAEALLQGKVRDPIAAAAGAYTLLRLGENRRLHDWTKNLHDWFEWLPDGIPIRAEHLARLGEHQRALRTLLDLPARGLPLFTDGLSYAVDRLRLYVGAGKSASMLEHLTQATAVLEQLQRFAAFVDFRKPVLTFTGMEPHKPDDEPFKEDIEDYDGLEVAEHLG